MIRRTLSLCSAALGFALVSGCVYHPPANQLNRYANSMIGQNLDVVTSQFGPEDAQGGSAAYPNIGTPQNPRYVHTWSRYGSTQHRRFVQTGTASAGSTLVTVLPAGEMCIRDRPRRAPNANRPRPACPSWPATKRG